MSLRQGNRSLRHNDIDILVKWRGKLPHPDVRDGRALSEVTMNQSCRLSGPYYYMFRDVARSPADRMWLEKEGLRYDITVIPPGELCGEFVKTLGHFHPNAPDGHGYPEVYEVLSGEAHYLIQERFLSSVALITARENDIVIIPPGYGHVTINPSRNSVLQMANIVSSRFESEYYPYQQKRGAAYYEITDRTFVKNSLYPQIPDLVICSADHTGTSHAAFKSSLYQLIAAHDPVLGFLNNPGRFPFLFQKALKSKTAL